MTLTPDELLARIQARCAERGITTPVARSTSFSNTGEGKLKCTTHSSYVSRNTIGLMSFPLPSTDNELTIGPLDRQSTAEEKEPASPVPWGEALTDNEKTIERPSEPTIAPLPDLDQITWARIELFDNGKSSKGMSRFVVSITATDLPVDEVDTWSSRKNTKRFANMQNPTAFRKAIRNLPADTLTRLEDLRQEVIEHNQFRKVYAPERK